MAASVAAARIPANHGIQFNIMPSIFFTHTAETFPIHNNGSDVTSYLWTSTQNSVGRSQDFAKNGSWSLKHVMDSGIDEHSGKIRGQFSAPVGTHTYGFVEAYYSAWYYLLDGFDDGPSAPNEGILKNNMQWLCRNVGGTINGGVKCYVGFDILDDVRQIIVSIDDHEIPNPNTTFPDFNWTGGGETQAEQKTPKTVPINEWLHVEVYIKAADPNRLGTQDTFGDGQQPGLFKLWQQGVLLYDLSHANFNMLTTFDQDIGNPNEWSDHPSLDFGGGAYGPSAVDEQVLYTDDWRVSDSRVFSTFDPPGAHRESEYIWTLQ